jgi:CRP-like cAMP-binding protein
MTTDIEKQFSLLAQQLGAEEARELRSHAATLEIASGTELICDGKPVDALYLVLDGVLTVSVKNNGQSLRLGRLGKGTWIGDVSLLSGDSTSSTSVTAETPATLLELKHDAFKQLTVERPDLASAIIRILIATLAERIRNSDAAIGQSEQGRPALQGSEKVVSHEAGKDKGRLRTMLQKLAGVEAE